ncbi:Hypothetical protein PBC10988_23330 [Planctomycetales bacterium 10988]|nr:Hypothetical protein PBC10988_23330 [Planctomycetales bacterium 10988]
MKENKPLALQAAESLVHPGKFGKGSPNPDIDPTDQIEYIAYQLKKPAFRHLLESFPTVEAARKLLSELSLDSLGDRDAQVIAWVIQQGLRSKIPFLSTPGRVLAETASYQMYGLIQTVKKHEKRPGTSEN